MALTPVQLKSLIDNNIKPNNRKSITGQMLNKVLNEIVDGYPAASSDTHIGNTNIVFTGARSIDQAGYQITWNNGDFRVNSSVGINMAPLTGYGLNIEGTSVGIYSQSINGKAGVFNSVNNTALEVGTGAFRAIVAQSTGDITIYGVNNAGGSGVQGYSVNGVGSAGQSVNSFGVSGTSTNSYGGSFSGLSGILGSGTTYGVGAYGGTAGVYAYSSGSGWGVIAYENIGSAGALNAQGKVLVNGTVASGATIFQIDSTTHGALLPRMTTTQFNAISGKPTGLMYYNTSRSRVESFNGTFSESAVHTISCTASQTSLTAGQTIYFGLVTGAPTTTSGTRKIRVTEACTMSGAYLYTRSGVAGSNEAWAVYIRVNDTTDHLVAIVSANTQERIWQNDSLQIDLIPNDYYEWKMVNPSWGTAPQNTTFGGYAKFK